MYIPVPAKDFYCLRLCQYQGEFGFRMDSVHLMEGDVHESTKRCVYDCTRSSRRGRKPSLYGYRRRSKSNTTSWCGLGTGPESTKQRAWDDAFLVQFIDDDASITYVSCLSISDLAESVVMNGPWPGVTSHQLWLTGIYSALIFRMDGYFLSYFTNILQDSEIYRTSFYNKYLNDLYHYSNCAVRLVDNPTLSVIISLKPPMRHPMDHLGSSLANSLLHEKHDLDCALSWLSTLGGAFSSLGESSLSWAKSAGEISLKQLKLAVRLKDPLVTSRCRIYLALSLIQREHLPMARYILEQEYKFFKSLPTGMDNRLGAICKGVWHKLKYHWDGYLEHQKQLNVRKRKLVSLRRDRLTLDGRLNSSMDKVEELRCHKGSN